VKFGNFGGHRVECTKVDLKNGTMTMRLVRLWWAPAGIAWVCAGVVPWWMAPYVFARVLVGELLRRRPA
jgi:hypothetical protein